jgi:hypothetical protein
LQETTVIATPVCVGFALAFFAGSIVTLAAGTLSAVFGLCRIIENCRRIRQARLAKNFNFMRPNLR